MGQLLIVLISVSLCFGTLINCAKNINREKRERIVWIDPKNVNWHYIEAIRQQEFANRNVIRKALYNQENRHALHLMPMKVKQWFYGLIGLIMMLSIYLVYRDKDKQYKDSKTIPMKILQKILLIVTMGKIKADF